MFKNLEEYQVVLASNSPRRQQLLKELGINFQVKSSQGEEVYPEPMNSMDVAEFLAIQKADWFTDFTNNELYITADTVVIYGDTVLGKPNSKEDAFSILKSLSGNAHKVVTGFCLKSKNKMVSKSVTTSVFFDDLTDSQIEYYIENYKPFDKAGSYGIQEWIGMIGISKIEGSYFNVMGLPSNVVYKELMNY